MILIQFNGSDESHEVTFDRVSDHVVSLSGDAPVNTSGFLTFRMNGDQLGDFSEFTTVYRSVEGYTEYSDDGSVYEEPEPFPDPEPDPDPEPQEESTEALILELMADHEERICLLELGI